MNDNPPTRTPLSLRSTRCLSLMALLLLVFILYGLFLSGRRNAAKNDSRQIERAVKAFEVEYGKIPQGGH